MRRFSKLAKNLRALRIALIERNKSIIGHYAYKINNIDIGTKKASYVEFFLSNIKGSIHGFFCIINQ